MKSNQNEWNGQQRRATRHPLQLCGLALLMVAVWVGCKQEENVAAADSNPVGSYTLVSVDGNKVPCAVQHEGRSVAVKSGTFIINADGTCRSKSVFSVPPGRDINREVKASYTHQGSNLTMRWEGAGTTTGTIEGGTFTMNNEGMVFAYRK